MSDTLYLVFELGGQRVAIASEIVDSVVHVTDIVPVPLAPPHIAGLAALRSRVITVGACPAVCSAATTTVPSAAPAAASSAAYVMVEPTLSRR